MFITFKKKKKILCYGITAARNEIKIYDSSFRSIHCAFKVLHIEFEKRLIRNLEIPEDFLNPVIGVTLVRT